MSSKIKVVNKGYTITVYSWEGAMNSQTNSITVETKEAAEIWYNMMALCKSKNNQPPGVIKLGDTVDWFDEEQTKLAVDFIKEYVIKIAPEFNTAEYLPTPMWDDEDCVETFIDLASELLGYSEYYCRACDSCTVTYSPEDIYVEEINI